MAEDPWSTRFLNAIPPMSDGLMVLWTLGLVLFFGILLGFALGGYFCAQRMAPLTPSPMLLPLHQHLDHLEQRVRTLEQR